MTTESHPPQDQPNEFGFAGDGTAPQPEPVSAKDVDGEAIAVPSGDITGAITEAIEEFTDHDRE